MSTWMRIALSIFTATSLALITHASGPEFAMLYMLSWLVVRGAAP